MTTGLHPLAFEVLLAQREEAERWVQYPAGPGMVFVERRGDPLSPDDTTGLTVEVRQERVDANKAADFLALQAVSAGLRAVRVPE